MNTETSFACCNHSSLPYATATEVMEKKNKHSPRFLQQYVQKFIRSRCEALLSELIK